MASRQIGGNGALLQHYPAVSVEIMKTKSSFSKYKCAHYKWYGLVKHISKKEDPNARILKSRKPGNIFIRLLACVQTQVNLIGGCWSSEGNPSSQDPAEALPCKLKVLLCKRTQMPDFASLRKPARIYGFVLTQVHTFCWAGPKMSKKKLNQSRDDEVRLWMAGIFKILLTTIEIPEDQRQFIGV